MSCFKISGLNAIIFRLTDQFIDIWEEKNKKRTPGRRLQELLFSHLKRDVKINGYYTIKWEPETEEYKTKRALLEKEVQ